MHEIMEYFLFTENLIHRPAHCLITSMFQIRSADEPEWQTPCSKPLVRPRYMDVPHSKAKVGVPGYVRCKRVRRPFTSDVPRYIVWGNTRARYILWAGYIYAWFVHGLIWVDPDRAYIMHARADESTEHNRLDYYWTFYAISVALNCAHHEWVTVHLLLQYR